MAFENGQLECVTDSPRQRLACAATSSAARQCEAWLSPMSATVSVACAFHFPNAQTYTRSRRAIGLQGEFSARRASSGVGTTPATFRCVQWR
jgi:hypothetical protein